MKYIPRIYFTETDKALMWDRWQKGEPLGENPCEVTSPLNGVIIGKIKSASGVRG